MPLVLQTGTTCSSKGAVSVTVTSPYLTKANPRYKSHETCVAGFGVILVSSLYVVLQLSYNYRLLLVNPHYLCKEKGGKE